MYHCFYVSNTPGSWKCCNFLGWVSFYDVSFSRLISGNDDHLWFLHCFLHTLRVAENVHWKNGKICYIVMDRTKIKSDSTIRWSLGVSPERFCSLNPCKYFKLSIIHCGLLVTCKTFENYSITKTSFYIQLEKNWLWVVPMNNCNHSSW